MSMLRPALQRLQQSRFVKAYLLALEQRPLTTKCTTSGLLMVGADATRQRLEDAEQPYDAPRTARLTAFAILIHAPFLHAYHPIAERLWARYDIRHTVVKVGLDQAFSAPVFLSIFLSFTALAEGLGASGARARVEQQLPLLWRDSLCCWGPAHLVTFNLPIPVRVLWQDVVRLYFGTIMSLRGTARIREDP
jgi:hypothetical protein